MPADPMPILPQRPTFASPSSLMVTALSCGAATALSNYTSGAKPDVWPTAGPSRASLPRHTVGQSHSPTFTSVAPMTNLTNRNLPRNLRLLSQPPMVAPKALHSSLLPPHQHSLLSCTLPQLPFCLLPHSNTTPDPSKQSQAPVALPLHYQCSHQWSSQTNSCPIRPNAYWLLQARNFSSSPSPPLNAISSRSLFCSRASPRKLTRDPHLLLASQPTWVFHCNLGPLPFCGVHAIAASPLFTFTTFHVWCSPAFSRTLIYAPTK